MISILEVLAIHDRVVEKTGGSFGVRDEGGLASAIARPFHTFEGNDLHPSLYGKAALLHSLCTSHPFVDGNKRVALVSAAYLLHKSGKQLNVPVEDGVGFMLEVAQGLHDVAAIAQRLENWTVRG